MTDPDENKLEAMLLEKAPQASEILECIKLEPDGSITVTGEPRCVDIVGSLSNLGALALDGDGILTSAAFELEPRGRAVSVQLTFVPKRLVVNFIDHPLSGTYEIRASYFIMITALQRSFEEGY